MQNHVIGQVDAPATPQLNPDQTRLIGASWVEFVPTWTAPTTNPAIGNGSVKGRYTRYGKIVHLSVRILMGSTTTYGTGVWRFGLPFLAKRRDDLYSMGLFRAYDVSATTNYIGVVVTDNTDKSFCQAYVNAATAAVDSAGPMTWANGDELSIALTYERES